MTSSVRRAFTLFELLIVVAIIAILAAIAVPNFLEAQTPSKIARSSADMRTVATAMESYIVDFGNRPASNRAGIRTPYSEPPGPFSDTGSQVPGICGTSAGGYAFSSWWGFIPPALTTPISFLSSLPTMTFYDDQVFGFWTQLGGSKDNQPHTYIRSTSTPAGWPLVVVDPPPALIPPTQRTADFRDQAAASGHIIYTAGPDSVDATA